MNNHHSLLSKEQEAKETVFLCPSNPSSPALAEQARVERGLQAKPHTRPLWAVHEWTFALVWRFHKRISPPKQPVRRAEDGRDSFAELTRQQSIGRSEPNWDWPRNKLYKVNQPNPLQSIHYIYPTNPSPPLRSLPVSSNLLPPHAVSPSELCI